MAKKKLEAGEVNKSQAIRNLLKENPKIKANEAVTTLAEKGVKVTGSLFYIVKGKALGRKSRRRKNQKKAIEVATAASGNGHVVSKVDALATILKLKKFAAEVGGLRTLKKLVDALSE
jgi:hypothetical protein